MTAARDPMSSASDGGGDRPTIASRTTVGAVHLSVSSLERSSDFYRRAVGLEILDQGAERASLGVGGRELVVLLEEPGARPADGFTGLFHFALLLPSRADLARWLSHAAQDRLPLVGLSDHFVSEALYLSDPDGHGIEIYSDRPREVWEGRVGSGMTTLPLDVDDLLAEIAELGPEPFAGLPPGTVMGHVHLRVATIPETLDFYGDVLGFELMARLGSRAAFFGAGGYHHHVGANTWQSAGAPPPPPGTARLRQATIVLPNAAELDRVTARLEADGREVRETATGATVDDPSRNALALAVGLGDGSR